MNICFKNSKNIPQIRLTNNCKILGIFLMLENIGKFLKKLASMHYFVVFREDEKVE